MCSGRVDPLFVISAFRAGADGVMVGGCKLGECKYVDGNFQALVMAELVKILLTLIGIDVRRFKLEWVSSAEPAKLVEDLKKFYEELKALGPLGSSEGISKEDLDFRLSCAEETLKNMQVRTAFGTVAKELKKLSDFSVETINQKVSEKLENLVKSKFYELEVKELLKDGPKSVDYLAEKTGAERSLLESILAKVVKA
jgi:F420-non-reducing hydrogenase iron-sulfur subunit